MVGEEEEACAWGEGQNPEGPSQGEGQNPEGPSHGEGQNPEGPSHGEGQNLEGPSQGGDPCLGVGQGEGGLVEEGHHPWEEEHLEEVGACLLGLLGDRHALLVEEQGEEEDEKEPWEVGASWREEGEALHDLGEALHDLVEAGSWKVEHSASVPLLPL